jgi:ribonuclease-3
LNLTTLQQALGVTFDDVSLLEQALVHDSYVNESPGFAPTSNERLEFLGDAVLGLLVGEKLFHDFPDCTEGQMTRLRARLVRREALARIASSISLGEYLFLGKGEEATGGRSKIPNLAGALEAIIGAIYLDRGLAITRDCIFRILTTEYDKAVRTGDSGDYKSQLQELIQAEDQQTPTYVLVGTSGPDHDRWFTVEVRLGEQLLGVGSGKSKKTAESDAAHNALRKLRVDG